ncbi:MAG: acetylglutamate kinase [Thermoflexales bacterium]|nr:acetylglutamate kinase [Thermoflexales bacterium]MCX7940111.1 acetylglutamate kinase [Thermoflexales bacterium]MDW8054047.1 acetylglutamate kinase [Anaerolineae bacterium]MDW8292618.1 acetylglutamate kinase [Anaerolineae bacterium]
MHVVKVGGNELDDASFVETFAAAVATLHQRNEQVVIVHGGGKALTDLLNALNIPTRFVDGLRVTDAPTRDAALMVLSGLTNKRLVAALQAHALDALGVSGIDGALVRAAPINEALMFVGKPTQVRTERLRALLAQGWLPVIAPVSLGEDGAIYNVNADHVASAIAAALSADLLTFVTNVAGVLDSGGVLLPRLTREQAEALIAQGVIRGGMIPKVRAALEALAFGVARARITNVIGLTRDLGTTFESV